MRGPKGRNVVVTVGAVRAAREARRDRGAVLVPRLRGPCLRDRAGVRHGWQGSDRRAPPPVEARSDRRPVGLVRALAPLCLLLVVLAGCSSDDEVTPLVRELEQAAKTNQPLLIEPGVGVGPVRFGMTREQIRGLIGEPYRTTGSFDEYQHLGLAVLFDDDARVQGILAGAWCEPSDILLDVFKGETADGLGLRASREELVLAFGEPLSVREIDDAFELLSYENWEFACRQGRLVHMTWRAPHPG